MLEDLDFDAASISGDDLGAGDINPDEELDEDELALMAAKRELYWKMMGNGSMVGVANADGDDVDETWQQEDLEDGELAELLADAGAGLARSASMTNGSVVKKSKKTRTVSASDPIKSSATKTKHRTNGSRPADETLDLLVEPTFAPSKASSSKMQTMRPVEDEFGDLTSLSSADASDKESRRRTLQFHTAKIAATSARREKARSQKFEGDVDVPYRDRQAARDAALRRSTGAQENANKRKTPDEQDPTALVADDLHSDGSEDDGAGYYDLVKRRRHEDKQAKVAAHEALDVDHLSVLICPGCELR